MLTILLLAAGSSSRMRGADKLLQEVDKAPLLRTLAIRALTTGAHVQVALPPDSPARLNALAGLDVTITPIADAHMGMGHSLSGAIAALPANTEAVMVLPADMPELMTEDFQTLINGHVDMPKRILRGASETLTPGHPVLFPKPFLQELTTLTGDTGARAILAANRSATKLVPLPGNRALLDLDTPEQWEDWRNYEGKTGAS